MQKPISRPAHGFTDYPYVAAASAAPELFGFEDEETAARLCRVFSAGILTSAILTRAEWGFVRVMPYRTHLALDLGAGLLALATPWLFGFAHNARARNTFLALGVFSVLAGTLSKPGEMP